MSFIIGASLLGGLSDGCQLSAISGCGLSPGCVQRGLSLGEQPCLCCDQALFKEFLLVDITFSPGPYLLGEGKELKKVKRCPPYHTKKGIMEDSLNRVSARAHSSLAAVDEQGTCGQQASGDGGHKIMYPWW